MSLAGVRKAAAAFETLQRTRDELMRMGCEAPATESGKQDILLGQLMEMGKNAMRVNFALLTATKIPWGELEPMGEDFAAAYAAKKKSKTWQKRRT